MTIEELYVLIEEECKNCENATAILINDEEKSYDLLITSDKCLVSMYSCSDDSHLTRAILEQSS